MSARCNTFVFPGQGSQKAGMLDDVPEHDGLERLLDAAEALSGLPLREVAAGGDAAALSDTRAAQPLLYLADWGWATALLECDLVPDYVAGHSLGELAALAIADVFSVEAGLELVVERSKLMAAAAAKSEGGMAAVLGLSSEAISDVVASIEGVWVANDNSPGQVVISGNPDGLARASELLDEAGARRIVPLNVTGPFHSPIMEPARKAFAALLAETEFNDAAIPILQNTAPSPTSEGARIRERLVGQITSPVRWTETMTALANLGPMAVIEMGPGRVLTGLAKGYENITAYAIDEVGIELVAEEVMR